MSINHYSMDLPETTLWWTQHQNPSTSEAPLHPSWSLQNHQPTWLNSQTHGGDPPNLHYNLNNQNDDDEEVEIENDDENNNNSATTTAREENKEPMFEKPLTPSDVGKLNRLVIPKQHAEKYFPLGASGGGGESGECKGLLLSFEDESGKCWRFRYSYWNSSQSYVLTKGWSRYVKDKRLDAGDVVLFERHRIDSQRLFINWRRRRPSSTEAAHVSSKSSDGGRGIGNGGVGVGWTRGFYSAHPYPAHQLSPYQHDCLHAGRGGSQQRTRPVVGNSSSSSSSSSRVLRLFGVNMECQPEQHSGPAAAASTPQCSSSYDDHRDSNNNNNNNMHYHQPPSSSSHSPQVLRHQPYYY